MFPPKTQPQDALLTKKIYPPGGGHKSGLNRTNCRHEKFSSHAARVVCGSNPLGFTDDSVFVRRPGGTHGLLSRRTPGNPRRKRIGGSFQNSSSARTSRHSQASPGQTCHAASSGRRTVQKRKGKASRNARSRFIAEKKRRRGRFRNATARFLRKALPERTARPSES